MPFIKNVKTAIAAAILSLTGSVASATSVTVVDFFANGDFTTFENTGGGDALEASGEFIIAFDPTFDPTKKRDFLLEASLAATNLPSFETRTHLRDVTGLDVLGFIEFSLNSLIPSIIPANILPELIDGTLAQSEVAPGFFLGFDYDVVSQTAGGVTGAFKAIFSEGSFAPVDQTSEGTFTANAAVSIVPLPASGFLLIAALAGVGAMRRRSRN